MFGFMFRFVAVDSSYYNTVDVQTLPADAKTSAKAQLGSSEVSVEGGEVERDMPQVIEETLHVKAKYKASLRRFTCRFTFENISKLGPILCIYIYI